MSADLPPGFVRLDSTRPAQGTALPAGFVRYQPKTTPAPKPELPTAQGEQAPNIAAKGDMVPGDRVKPDLHATAAQGMTLNTIDEIASGLSAPVRAAYNAVTGKGPTSVRENFDQSQARQAAQLAATREEYPVASVATEIGGALATAPFSGGARLLATGTKLVKAGKAAAAGAGYGAVAGAASGEGAADRIEKAKSGAKQALPQDLEFLPWPPSPARLPARF